MKNMLRYAWWAVLPVFVLLITSPTSAQHLEKIIAHKDSLIDLTYEEYRYSVIPKKALLDSATQICLQYGIEDKFCAYAFKQLGIIHTKLNDFELAKSCYETCLRLSKTTNYHKSIINSQIELASLDALLGNEESAIRSLTMLLDTSQHIEALQKAYILVNLGYYHLDSGKTPDALKQFEKADQLPVNDAFLYFNIAKGLADANATLQQYQKAVPYYQEAIDVGKKYIGPNSRDLGKLHLARAELLHLPQQDFQAAIEDFQLALQTVLPEYAPEGPLENPSVDLFFAENVILEGLHGKAMAYWQAYQAGEGNLEQLQSALESNMLMLEIEALLRKEMQVEEAKYLFQLSSKDRREDGIEIAYELYAQTGKEEYINSAFILFEQSRATLLQENFNELEASFENLVSEELFYRERELRKQLDLFYLDEVSLINAGKTETDLVPVRDTINVLEFQQKAVLKKIRQAYPNYYQRKYEQNLISLDSLQKELLINSQGLIEYFVGARNVYAIALTPTQKAFRVIPLDFPLTKRIAQLQLREASHAQWVEAAHELYQKLFQPISRELSLPEDLIIVPSDELGLIPFEILLSDMPKYVSRNKSHAYLLREHAISYNFSATLWQEMKAIDIPDSDQGFLGIAPDFQASDSAALLSPLFYTQKEVKKIRKLVGGKTLTGAEANKETFLKLAGNYRLIHLATHGFADEELSSGSFLAFASNADRDLLYIRELYSTALRAQMVVLSACETGIGEIKAGEGVVSLARSFSYSGTKSIVTTLWNINDLSAMELMEDFYQNLKDGMDKSHALRQAKLDFLDRHPQDEAHPFYWAAFIPIGDTQPIDFPALFPLWAKVLIGVFLLAWLFYLVRNYPLQVVQGSAKQAMSPQKQ